MDSSTWFVTIFLGLVIICLLQWLSKVNRQYWETKGVTYIESPPIIGIVKDFLLLRKSVGDIIGEIYRNHEGEKLVGYFQFVTPTVMIRDPEIVNRILIKDFRHFEDRGPLIRHPRDLFTRAFGNLSGDKWRDVRQKLTSAFSSGKMKAMFGPTKECSEQVVIYLNNKTNQEVESRQLMFKFVLNVIGNIAFGLNIDTFSEKEQKSVEFFKYSSLFFKPSFFLIMKFLISLTAPKIFNTFKMKLTDQCVENFFSTLTKHIIKHRQGTNMKRNDFLQIMLDLRNNEYPVSSSIECDDYFNKDAVASENQELINNFENSHQRKNSTLSEIFTEEFMAAQIFIFISGGSETVAATLSFVLFELAQNQNLQRKVQDEINDVTSSHGFKYESIKKLTYMDQFINETFRLHPVSPSLLRLCTKTYKVPGTDVIIEKGNFINIPIASFQVDPNYFHNPEKFDPDRFQDIDSIPKGIFFPFGGGPRMCIAMRLAMMEMKVLLATLLSNYDVTLSDKTKVPLKIVKSSFLTTIEGGIWVKFHKRNG